MGGGGGGERRCYCDDALRLAQGDDEEAQEEIPPRCERRTSTMTTSSSTVCRLLVALSSLHLSALFIVSACVKDARALSLTAPYSTCESESGFSTSAPKGVAPRF